MDADAQAKAQHLEALSAAFPEEIAAACALAEAQRAAMAALPLDREDAP